ncbi:MAG: PHP domain-containing protein [Alphaproteobacteria bacterium]|nr:PHP domain-containing protein [Alphaproteobacteria bacterium]
MIDPKFVHLRVHTAYSLALGAIPVSKLLKKMRALKMPACAITDRGNLFGGKCFSKIAADEGIKPILGAELSLHNSDSENLTLSKGRELEPERIVLLVKNAEGYKSIMHLFRRYYLDNMENSIYPQINMQNLRDFNEGLICLTGGFEGPLGQRILQNRKSDAEKMLLELKEIFGDRLYMEISRVGYDDEQKTEPAFLELAYKHNVPLVATNDVFFMDEDMYEAHDALVCIAEGEYVANENRHKFMLGNHLRT